jgi:hypothetical protein
MALMTTADGRVSAARVGLLCLAAALAIMAVALPASASAQPLYPDLRMTSPTNLHLLVRTVDGAAQHQLRFTTRPWNAGAGPFELHRQPDTSGIAALRQRVYEDPAGFHDETIGSAIFDPLDFIFFVPHIARYELWTARGFARAESRGFTRGQPLAYRDGVSHCVADREQIDTDASSVAVYQECNKLVLGLSVGWADVETWPDDNQAIDLGATPLPDGDYIVRVIVDPDNLLFESDGKSDPAREGWSANSGTTYFRLIDGVLAGIDDF